MLDLPRAPPVESDGIHHPGTCSEHTLECALPKTENIGKKNSRDAELFSTVARY